MTKRKDKYLRKPVVFNRQSHWHMEILDRINKDSQNFSSYVMSILKSHFRVEDETKENVAKEKLKAPEVSIPVKEKSEPPVKKVRNEMKPAKIENKPKISTPQVFINNKKS